MASCFDFRMRTTSFDLHQLTRGTKMARFSRLFRSKSENDAILTSPKSSPKPSPGAPHRRRFVRVVRNAESEGEEYENPHVVRKYTKDYWEQTQLPKSVSLEEGVDRPLPYTVSGNTILKKHGSVDSDSSPPTGARHAIFKEDVQVIEFDKKEKIKKRICYMHDEKLIDSSDDTDTSSSTNQEFEIKKHRIKGRKMPPVDLDKEPSEDESETLSTSAGNVTISEVRREDLVLGLIPAYEGSSICSPVKEEDDEFPDSGSEASSEFSSDGPLPTSRRRDWTEEDDLSTPSMAAKIMSAHAGMKTEDKTALISES